MSALAENGWQSLVAMTELPARGRASCAGVVEAVTILPATVAPSYSAILTDKETPNALEAGANHQLRLVWIGRRRVPGIAAGTRLRVEGMVSQRNGLPTMYNPRYEIVGTQES